jgi:transcriptional regulator GlxA family with amidase domain
VSVGQGNESAGTNHSRRRVAICVWDDIELLDFAGPGEVFAAAEDGAAFHVCTVGETRRPVVSQGFLRIVPEYDIMTCPAPDIVVLPGGGASFPLDNPQLRTWLLTVLGQAEVVLSVCTGAFVLAGLGLLDGLDATTWYGDIDRLRKAAPITTVHKDRRFIDNGRIVTAAGVSAGIDAALHIVDRLCGRTTSVATARYMEYEWAPDRFRGAAAPTAP